MLILYYFFIYKYHISLYINIFILIMWGGGQLQPCDARICVKCLCSNHNNTALIKQLSLFDTALVMKITF